MTNEHMKTRLAMAARSGGLTGLVSVALDEALDLLRMVVTGSPYRRIMPKVYTGTQTLNVATGQVVDFLAGDFSNDGKYPFRLQSIIPITTTGTSNWRLSVQDASTLEVFFGAPNRVRYEQIIDARRHPTGIGHADYEIDPNGGFIPQGESIGVADVVEVSLKGYWIVER